MNTVRILFCSFLLLAGASALAANAAEPLTDAVPLSIRGWIDSKRELRPADILKKDFASGLEISNLGYLNAPLWLRIPIRMPSPDPEGWVLRLDPPLINEVDLYEFNQAGKLIFEQSFRLTQSVDERPLPSRVPSFRIHLPAEERGELVLRLSSPHNLNVDLSLTSSKTSIDRQMKEQLLLAVYYGVLAAIFVLNFFIYVVTREKAYLAYLAFVLSMAGMLSILNGLLDAYLPTRTEFVFARYLCVLSCLTLLAATQFTRSFLRTASHHAGTDRILRSAMGVAAVIGLIAVTPLFHRLSMPLGYAVDLTIVLTVSLVFFSGARAFKAGFRPALFFLISWGMLVAMVLIYFAAAHGLIGESVITRYAVQIGSCLEMIFLSLALVWRIQALTQEKIAAEFRAKDTARLRSLMRVTVHDVGNPLSAILAFAQLSARQGGDWKWESVEKAALELKSVIDHVRAGELAADGEQALKLEPVSLRDTLETVRFIFARPLQEKRIELVSTIVADDPDLLVHAHRAVFCHTVLGNLVSNAIKFSEAGSRIGISARRRNDRIEILVVDSGIGIPKAMQARLLARDANVHRPGTHGEDGTGFGMTLAASAVEAFGGEMRIESHSLEDGPGENGTRIILSLKSVRVGGDPRPAPATPGSQP